MNFFSFRKVSLLQRQALLKPVSLMNKSSHVVVLIKNMMHGMTDRHCCIKHFSNLRLIRSLSH